MIEYYLAGLGTTLTALLIWFYSPMRSTLGQILISKNIHTNDDFETALLYKSPFFGKLFGCYICCSFWGSLAVGVIFYAMFDLPGYFPFLTWSTYPSVAYLYKTVIDMNK